MQSYSQLMHATLWAVTVITLSDAAVKNRDQLVLAQAREEHCVVEMGAQLADLEARVYEYLKVYRDTLEPQLGEARAD